MKIFPPRPQIFCAAPLELNFSEFRNPSSVCRRGAEIRAGAGALGVEIAKSKFGSDDMEPNEAQELQEQQEKGLEGRMKPVSFSMAVLAVLVAIVTVMGHRSHTEAVLLQAKASDQWNLYQAKKIRQNDTELATDLLSALAVRDPAAGKKLADGYNAHEEKWTEDLKEEQNEALKLEAEVKLAERKADRFDLGEALLEIGLVVSSITLLTRLRAYWYMGLIFGVAGVIVASFAFTVR
jgi:hypothetical protein